MFKVDNKGTITPFADVAVFTHHFEKVIAQRAVFAIHMLAKFF